jgi:hypothetical protein
MLRSGERHLEDLTERRMPRLVDLDVILAITGFEAGNSGRSGFSIRVVPRETLNQSLVPDNEVSGGRFFIYEPS